MLFSICKKAREARRAQAIEDIEVVCHYSDDYYHHEETRSPWLKRICNSLRRNDPKMAALDIDAQKSSLCDADIMALYDALNHNHVVSNLMFRHLELKMDATLNLTPILQNTQSIQQLHIEESGTKEQIAVCMALSVAPFTSIETLHLRGNLIDLKSAEALGLMLTSNRSLKELRLCHNRIDPKGVTFFAEGLRKWNGRALDLLGNGLGDEAVAQICKSISCNKSIEFLCLDFNDFGYDGIESIASMLEKNNVLTELHLFGNRIDALGAGTLARALTTNSTLSTLILSYNQIGDAGASALAKALTVNKTLKKLWFPSNEVGNEGLQTIGKFLSKMKGLEQLYVGDLFDDFATEDLLEGLKFNTRLSVLYVESPIYENDVIEEKLDFYLRLNRCGRSLLNTPNAPISLWAKALGKASNHQSRRGAPDALFQMLRQKPELFDFISGSK